jgi:HJR/Mrr/RecB family endonuclease
MSTALDSFVIGELYSNEEIYRSLGVGNAGGVRAKLVANGDIERLVMMTSVPSARQLKENPYHDRIEGDTLIYTGAGREGDQTISGPNARIVEQARTPFPIFGFILMGSRRDPAFSSKRWAFLGLLEYLRCYRERQLDASGEHRSAWVFELRVLSGVTSVKRDESADIMTNLFDQRLPDADQEREVVYSSSVEEGTNPSADYAALEATRRQLLLYEPRQFEFFLRDLLLRSGFQQVEVTKYSQDGGIDVNATPGQLSWPIRKLLVQLQAKRWLHTVGRREVAELRGSLQPHAAGCIVTTSHYSRAALAEAIAPGKTPINLVDGYELAGLVNSLGMAVA